MPDTEGVPQLSVAVGLLIAIVATHVPMLLPTVILAGQIIVGGTVSFSPKYCPPGKDSPCVNSHGKSSSITFTGVELLVP